MIILDVKVCVTTLMQCVLNDQRPTVELCETFGTRILVFM